MIEPPASVGTTARGGTILFVPFVPNSGSVKSEASYPIQLDAEFVHGADYVRMDPNGENVRLEIHSVAKDKATGALFRFSYTGTVSLAGPAGKVFRGEPDMATTGFGDACECWLFFPYCFRGVLRGWFCWMVVWVREEGIGVDLYLG